MRRDIEFCWIQSWAGSDPRQFCFFCDYDCIFVENKFYLMMVMARLEKSSRFPKKARREVACTLSKTKTLNISSEQAQEMPMVDLAFHILKKADEPYYYRDLMKEIARIKGIGDDQMLEVIAQVYTEINIDGRFACVGNNVWGLKRWYPVDKSEDGVTSGKRPRIINDDDDDEEELFDENDSLEEDEADEEADPVDADKLDDEDEDGEDDVDEEYDEDEDEEEEL